jgi:starch synthase
MPPLKLCLLSSEIVPYAKTGGLADVAGALLHSLRAAGHEVRAFMPLYAAVGRKFTDLQPVSAAQRLTVNIGATLYTYSLRSARYPGTDIPVYFVDCPALYDRGALYTLDADEHRRFLLLTLAALEGCRRLGFAPHIFHCHDWHTALLPLLLKTQYGADPLLSQARSLLTIHNIGYQGVFPASAAADLGVGSASSQLDPSDMAHGVINPLKAGIQFADKVSTVSPTYAREICDSALGMGLESALRARTDRVAGILNGVD